MFPTALIWKTVEALNFLQEALHIADSANISTLDVYDRERKQRLINHHKTTKTRDSHPIAIRVLLKLKGHGTLADGYLNDRVETTAQF